MTREYLQLLVDYHYWARDRALDAVRALDADQYTRPMGNSFSSVRDTLNHLYFAEWIWYSRWHGESPSAPPPIDLPDVQTLDARWKELEAKVRAFAEGLSDADRARVIDYKLLSGQAGSSPIWQMLAHVVNHASYHRGQVVTLLRQLGAAPPGSMDMIAFFRERAA